MTLLWNGMYLNGRLFYKEDSGQFRKKDILLPYRSENFFEEEEIPVQIF